MARATDIDTKGAEEARNTLPTILDHAENGRATIITKHGRQVAAIVPIAEYNAYLAMKPRPRQPSILSLRGSGSGLWGEDSTRTLRELRDEWTR
jgi:prevent-host-death family protein